MNDDDLLSIGGFSLASSLSIAALRHYDEVGILPPAVVDPATGYRRYRPEQLEQAHTIRALRQVQVPLDVVHTILDQPGLQVAILRSHRAALAAKADELAEMVRTVDHYIDSGGVMPTAQAARIVQVTVNVTDHDAAVAFYEQAFAARYTAEISSLQFGEYPGDDFFLLTLEQEDGFGPSRFGLTVADVDAAHRRALAAGATEIAPPHDAAWKPRSSFLADPSGNHISLFQG